MKTDAEIQKDVIEQLKWEPLLNTAEIGVSVKKGIVTLSGQLDSYLKKLTAERSAKKVNGVLAVAEDIQVGMSPENRKTDTEIAEAVLNALKWHTAVTENKIKIKVENGIVTLEGEVEWLYQRSNAASAIESLVGVKAINNWIVVKPKATAENVKQKINAALIRYATIDASKIFVTVIDNKVILEGTVRSFKEKEDAENAALSAPGVSSVENRIQIAQTVYAID